MLQYEYISSAQTKKYAEKWWEFEKHFSYPLSPTVSFKIDHGEDYSAFFRAIGEASFLLVWDQDVLVGCLAVVEKNLILNETLYPALYLADLKIRPNYQGRGISRNMYQTLQDKLTPELNSKNWSLIYFVAMQGERGDVMNSGRPHSLLSLFKPVATLRIYFVEPVLLASLKTAEVKESFSPEQILHLSPPMKNNAYEDQWVVDLTGKKDLILDTTNSPLSLVHVAASSFLGTEYLQFLAQSGEYSKDRHEICCFCLDERREALICKLEKNNIVSDSQAKVYTYHLENKIEKANLVQMGTFQI